MPYCPECGEEVVEGYMFCPECGHDLGDVPVGQSTGGGDDAWGASNDDRGGLSDGPSAAGSRSEQTETIERAEPIPTAGGGGSTADAGVERTTDVDGASPFTDGPLSHALGYATRESRDPVVIGGIIEFAGAIIPFISLLVRGFGFRIAKASARGQTEPPEFDEYGEMFVDGFRLVATGLVFLTVFGFGGAFVGVLASMAHETAGAVVMLVAFLGAVYLFPASLTAYAAHGTITHAVSPSYAGAFALTATYLKAYVLFVLVNFGVGVVTTIAFVTIIGILAIPFIVAWSIYVDSALWGYYYREAVERDEVPPAPAEPV